MTKQRLRLMEKTLVKFMSANRSTEADSDAALWRKLCDNLWITYHFDSAKAKFLDLAFAKTLPAPIVCMEVGICDRTYSRWKVEIITLAYLWAAEMNLLALPQAPSGR